MNKNEQSFPPKTVFLKLDAAMHTTTFETLALSSWHGGGGASRTLVETNGLLVYWGLTPQQQPGSYQGGEMMMKPMC